MDVDSSKEWYEKKIPKDGEEHVGAGSPFELIKSGLEDAIRMAKKDVNQTDLIALLDMDGTVADYVGQMNKDLAKLRGPDEKVWEMSHDIEFPDHIWNRIEMIKNSKNWWRDLPVLSDGMDLLEMVESLGFDIHVLTKGPRNTMTAWSQKVEWCCENLPEDVSVTITHDKSLVYGRILIDDYPVYMDSWLEHRPRGLGIMPLREYNKDYRHPNVIHYTGANMDEVKRRVEHQKNRKSGQED